MTKKFAVFIDIDGTLTDDDGMNPQNAVAIAKARKAGHYIFINTGRAKSWINPKLLKDIKFDGIISGMGSRIEIGEDVIFENAIDQDIVYKCVKHFLNTKSCFFVSGVENGFILNPIHYFYGFDFPNIDNPKDFLGKYKDEKIQKIEMFGDVSEKDKRFLSRFLDIHYHYGKYIECYPKGCKKSTAMNIVLDYLGIKKENSIAIGDSVNDIDMLKNAGIAVVMGNASDAVKQIADFVSTPCRDGGVGYAIEELLLKKN